MTGALPAHLLKLIEATYRRRANQEPCAPDALGLRDQRYARQPRDGSAGYHLWSPTTGLHVIGCHHGDDSFEPPWREEQLEPPVPAVHVPSEQRCGGWVAPRYFPRPYIGPLPEQWPGPRIPRWYAWWRLHDIQDGTCATCEAPAYAIDHDHVTSLVRGLLCISCNKREGMCRRRTGGSVACPTVTARQYLEAFPIVRQEAAAMMLPPPGRSGPRSMGGR
ncbi:endonuclease VII domain-containing protein [Streptomyces salinarius]|uniref:Endonuclease VII domain-containing protein n=1 Tax=Streptomyces salinarius TaxID=2762598 RepID=A0ABW8BNU2_9ACTN